MIICATGHRDADFNNAKLRLKSFLEIQSENITAISGMARGWDTIFARACLYYNIPLSCYVPYKGQNPTTEYYDDILSQAKVLYIDGEYNKQSFLNRDKAMVDNSDIVIAGWDGRKKGGTFYTINYAIKQKRLVINLF